MKINSNIPLDVALRKRLISLYDNNSDRVRVSFSGGKDSLVVLNEIYSLAIDGLIDAKKIVVDFIDEEAIFPCVEKIVTSWRNKIVSIGGTFNWYALEFKHFNCFNQLSSDESFICFDKTRESVWVRRPPDYAITSSPLFKKGMTYQQFMSVANKDKISVIGVRANESVQRLSYLKKIDIIKNKFYPIYDFSNNDIWLYIKKNDIEFPDAYLYMWKLGISIKDLRISQFFSVDTAKNLVRMVEYYPGLYNKILKREPNAYLSMYYWDTSMFGRTTSKGKKLAGKQIDYKNKFNKVKSSMHKFSNYKIIHNSINKIFFKYGDILASDKNIENKVYKFLCSVAETGDPKARTLRAVFSMLHSLRMKK